MLISVVVTTNFFKAHSQLTSTPQKCVVTENILLTTYFAYTPKDFLFSKYVFTRAKPKEKDFLFF